jgi:ribose transport system substrate-binding protein
MEENVMKTKLSIGLLCLILVFSMFAGCATSQTADQAEEQTGDADTTTDTADTAVNDADTSADTDEAEPASKEIAFIPPTMANPFYMNTVKGAETACEEMGYELLVQAPSSDQDANAQVAMVENMILKGVAGIAVCALDSAAIVPALEKANEAGIPIVIFNTLTDLDGGDVYAYVGYDEAAGAAMIADWVAANGEDPINVLMLLGLPGFHATLREDGFADRVEAEYADKINIVAREVADWNTEKGLNVTQNQLQTFPEINVIYGANDDCALGGAQAAVQAGRDDILSIGIDGNPSTMEAIDRGDLSATLYVNPVGIGYGAIQALNDAINGVEKQQNNKIAVEIAVVDKTIVADYLE